MKTKETTLEKLSNIYSHPSAAFFRAIELKAIYENTKGISFNHPSLDLGCGDGKIAKLLFDENFSYGLDNGEAKDVEVALKNKVYGKVFLESAEKMSLPDNCLNFVFSNCVLEHIPDNEAVLQEISRVLKKGGDFVFTVPSHNFPEYLYLTNKFISFGLGFLSRFYKYRRNKMLNHFHCYSISDWEKRLNQCGFKITKHKYYVGKEALMLWDKMALEIFIGKFIFGKFAEKLVSKKYIEQMRKHYDKTLNDTDEGAGLFIQL